MSYQLKSNFRIRVLSRHPSHSILRKELPEFPVRSLVRLGSNTPSSIAFPIGAKLGKKIIEINSVEAVKNSASKLLMKQKFTEAGVKTAEWWTFEKTVDDEGGTYEFLKIKNNTPNTASELPYPIIAKHIFGSRGTGNYKLNSKEELEEWMGGRKLENYIFERLIPYKLEFRFHVSEDGAFYVCRKALKESTPESKRWMMNSDSCVWYMENNEKFLKPNSYSDIESECIKALKAIGADILAFDVRVQSELNSKGQKREYQDFFLVESNSAPSFGSFTGEKYLKQIPIILNKKLGTLQ